MTVNERIFMALSPLGYPVESDVYTGDETIYMTFNYSTRNGLFADDAPCFDVYLVQVHLFTPYGWNSASVRKQIKKRLFEAGFTWPIETDAANEHRAESSGQHLVFACEVEEGVTLDE